LEVEVAKKRDNSLLNGVGNTVHNQILLLALLEKDSLWPMLDEKEQAIVTQSIIDLALFREACEDVVNRRRKQ